MQKTNLKKKRNTGFTLIEILVVIGMIALLAAVVIVAINPARQFAQGRNTQRTSNVNTILNAIGQNMADNKGVFKCDTATIATTSEEVVPPFNAEDMPDGPDGAEAIDDNFTSCLVPTYISIMPVDPADGTGYYVIQDSSPDGAGRITVFSKYIEPALGAAADQDLISATR